MKSTLAKLAVLAVSGFLSLALLEFGLSLVYRLPLPVRAPQVRYDDHPTRLFTLRPGQSSFSYDAPVEVGDDGLRSNGPLSSATTSARRIVALGDSFTFGMGVGDDETWPSRLEALLEAQRDDPEQSVRVYNLGTTSYGVEQELDLLREFLPALRPDLVIHGLYWNDYMASGHSSDGPFASALKDDGTFLWDPESPESTLGRLRAGLSQRSRSVYLLGNLLRSALQQAEPGEGQGTNAYEDTYQAFVAGEIDEPGWQRVRNFYRQLDQLGEEEGFEVLVVVFPVLGIIEGDLAADHPYLPMVAGLLEGTNIRLVDGFEVLEAAGLGRDSFLPYNRHLDAAGYDAIARALVLAVGGSAGHSDMSSARSSE